MIIAIDVDDTVAELVPAWLNAYNDKYSGDGPDLKYDEIAYWTAIPDKARCGAKVYNLLTSDLYNNVKPINGACQAVDKLVSAGHEIWFATTAMREHAGAKATWLRRHSFINDIYSPETIAPIYIETPDKTRLRADIIVDDKPETVERFPGYAILYDRPWNQECRTIRRAHNWEEVLKFIGDIEPLNKAQQGSTGQRERFRHTTEDRCPEQTQAFRELIEAMYQTHLDKNADYSPANILATGQVGLVTRLWDKTARLLNLQGFRFSIEEAGTYEPPRQPKNESIEDTYMDLAVYALIGLIVRQGKWGK